LGKQAWVWLSVCWLSVAASSVARAQTCTLADGCPKGFTCVTPPCAVAPVDCKPGTPCVQPTPVCDSVCEPAACQADADCGADMVCHSETISACTGVATPACAPGSKCTSFAAPTPPTCTDQTTSQCAYKYDLACTQDTDCGTGFSCNAGQECSCSGSSGTAIGRPTPAVDAGVSSQPIQPTPPPQVVSPDAGAAAKPAKDPGPSVDGGTVSQPNCECHASALKSCELQPIDCTQDSDCPASLKCSVWSEGTVSVSCAKGSDAGCVVDPSTASPEIKRCQPASKGVDRGGVATSGSLGSSTTPTTAPIASANGAAGSVASTPPVVPEASHDQQPTAATPSTTPAPACSVRTLAGSSRPFGLVGFGLAGLGLALRSRRRRNAR
jgi:hypothetical protein